MSRKVITDELPLFDPVLRARPIDAQTSQAAMTALDGAMLWNAVDVVIRLHVQYGPMADYQLIERFRQRWGRTGSPHLYRQARSVARDRGRIRDTGRRVVNPTSKRRQIVWEACEGTPVTVVKCPTCGHVRRRI